MKTFLKNEEEIKIFSDKRKLRGLVTSRSSLQEMLRKFYNWREVKPAWISALQEGMKNTRNSKCVGKYNFLISLKYKKQKL